MKSGPNYRGKSILVIDDDPQHIENIQALVEDQNITMNSCGHPEQIKDLFNHPEIDYSTILLDRHFLEDQSLDILKNIKKHPVWSHIPVVMLTDNYENHDIVDCVNAGAYYYLPKPLDSNIFKSVINRAITDFMRYKVFIDKAKNAQIARLIQSGHVQYRTLKEGHEIADWLATLCSGARNDIVVGFIELLVNAVEHGNLGIGFEQKSELLNEGTFLSEVLRRLHHEDYRDKFVDVKFERHPGHMVVRIEDQGAGFDYNNYLKDDPNRLFISHGRGIAMAKGLYFDHVEYLGRGNIVEVSVSL